MQGVKEIIESGTLVGKCLFIKEISSKSRRRGLFKCMCGKDFERDISFVKKGFGCGCEKGIALRKENKNRFINPNKSHGYTEGKSKTEYNTWLNMKSRCYNKNNKSYKDYGKRGIIVCDRWLESFENFIYDMGNKPSDVHSIDRKDVNGNYEACNCRWATRQEQMRNKTTNRKITHNGETLCLVEWSERFGLSRKLTIKKLNLTI